MVKVELNLTTYVLFVTASEFLFRVEVSVSEYATSIDSIRCKDDQDVWRETKYSIKKQILSEVEESVMRWVKGTSTWVVSVS